MLLHLHLLHGQHGFETRVGHEHSAGLLALVVGRVGVQAGLLLGLFRFGDFARVVGLVDFLLRRLLRRNDLAEHVAALLAIAFERQFNFFVVRILDVFDWQRGYPDFLVLLVVFVMHADSDPRFCFDLLECYDLIPFWTDVFARSCLCSLLVAIVFKLYVWIHVRNPMYTALKFSFPYL